MKVYNIHSISIFFPIMKIAVVGYATYKRSNCEVVGSMRGTLKIASITHSTSPSYSYWPRAVSIIKGPAVCFICNFKNFILSTSLRKDLYKHAYACRLKHKITKQTCAYNFQNIEFFRSWKMRLMFARFMLKYYSQNIFY